MIFFQSSMPRSCSTLLQNIMAQNPLIHATPTDGVLELLYAARINFTNQKEFHAIPEAQRMKIWRAFCKGGLEAYVSAMSNRPHTCIKSRGIGIHYDWFSVFMGEQIKVICMVRDIRNIMASMEKLHRKSCDNHSGMVNHAALTGTSTYKRCLAWINAEPVGLAIERFQQMELEGIASKCLFVRAEDLTSQPEFELARIYEYLQIDNYQHDFTSVEQFTTEDDSVYELTSDLHKTRREVKSIPDDSVAVLGRDVCEWLSKQCEWYQHQFRYA